MFKEEQPDSPFKRSQGVKKRQKNSCGEGKKVLKNRILRDTKDAIQSDYLESLARISHVQYVNLAGPVSQRDISEYMMNSR